MTVTSGIAVGTLCAALLGIPAVRGLEQQFGLQWLFDLRGPVEPPEHTILVLMNESSADSISLRLIGRLAEAGVKLVIFDALFRERPPLPGPGGDLNAWQDDMVARAAAANSNLLDDRTLQGLPLRDWLWITFLSGLLAFAICRTLGNLLAIAIVVGLSGAYVAVASHVFGMARLWMPVVLPISVAVPTGVIVAMGTKFWVAFQQRARPKRRWPNLLRFRTKPVRYNSTRHEPLPPRTLRIEPVCERAGVLRRGPVRALPRRSRERQPRMA